jgi:hypothetical protein
MISISKEFDVCVAISKEFDASAAWARPGSQSELKCAKDSEKAGVHGLKFPELVHQPAARPSEDGGDADSGGWRGRRLG